MNKFYWMAIGLLLGLVNLRAEIKLPALVGDNMVLQQATKVRLWGNATPNSSLKVRSSWDNTEYTAQVNDQGRWEIWVQTPSASFEKQQLTLENGQDKIVLHDLLIGEVWFGSGQSNMEMPLRGFWHCPIEGGNHAIATSGKYKNSIRYATIQRVGALEPKDYPVGGEWKVCDPRNAPEFGATAYFFATLLTEVLNVPVGIINCSWGGSTVEGWLPKDILRNYSDIDLSLAGNDEKIHPMLQPMIMYNGMLKPASKYTVRGFLWYQGESNVGHLELVGQYLENNFLNYPLYELKRTELFYLLKKLYRKEELDYFFYLSSTHSAEFERLIAENYIKAKTVTDLAQMIGYGVNSFRMKFKKVFGIPAYEWLMQEKSKRLLVAIANSEDDFKNIIDEFDFSSHSHFYKFCKARFGYSPTELRKKLKSL